MKLPLASGVLSSAAVFDSKPAMPSACGRWVMRVDRAFDRKDQPASGHQLPPDSYRELVPSDRWEVTLNGSNVRVRQLDCPRESAAELDGSESASVNGVRYFELRTITWGGMTGGRFVLRGSEAELTLFGSDVPVVLSERGPLVSHVKER